MLNQYADEDQAVSSVVAVLGTTVEGAVDQLDEIVRAREKLQQEKGMSFAIHVDGAWGGYFASMRRPKGQAQTGYSLGFRDRVNDAYCAISKMDSITIDPHKSGYIQYPVCLPTLPCCTEDI
jgi:glutamate/tyrosine decarboxylase-like PLP-dependent enzyme